MVLGRLDLGHGQRQARHPQDHGPGQVRRQLAHGLRRDGPDLAEVRPADLPFFPLFFSEGRVGACVCTAHSEAIVTVVVDWVTDDR